MKAMKKSVTLVLVLVMVLGCAVLPAAAAGHPFTDVSSDKWYHQYVQYVYDNGLMNGTSGTKFEPEGKMSRAMLVTVLYRLDGKEAVSGSIPFTDVKDGTWYTDAVKWAHKNGVVNGTSTTTFSPDNDITRQDMVTIFYRYASMKGYDVSNLDGLTKYTDAGKISSYARNGFAWGVANGIITGNSATTLNPTGNATRAECATIISRFDGWVDSNSSSGSEGTTPTEPTPTEPVHSHSYTETVTKPTCTAEGYTTYTCACGDSYVGNKVSATGHNWGSWVTTKEPTTTSEGVSERKCSSCGATETKSLPKVVENHTHSYTGTVTTPATCTNEGVKTFTCSCGNSYTERINKTKHNYVGAMTTVPTCTSGGVETFICSSCRDSYSVPVEATGHAYTNRVAVEPTCTGLGVRLYTCLNCEEYYEEFIPMVDHVYDLYPFIVAPSCEMEGFTEYRCAYCTYRSKVDIKPATGHNCTSEVTKEATCTEDGVRTYSCTNDYCHYSYTEVIPAGHSWETVNEAAEGYTEVWTVYDCGHKFYFGIYEEYLEIGNDAYDYEGRDNDYDTHVAGCDDNSATHNWHNEKVWVETKPAVSYDKCSVCGATK